MAHPNEEKTNMCVICLDNTRIRKAVEAFELIVDLSIVVVQYRLKWNYCIPHHQDGMELLRHKRKFSDEEIKKYQYHHIDNWFQVWTQLLSLHGCTNYMNMLSLEHLAEYIFKWRNLHHFSQKGWENFNHVF